MFWLVGISYVTGENFLDVLDNGAELCQLAAVIYDRAREKLDQGLVVGVSFTPVYSVSNVAGPLTVNIVSLSFF